MVLRDPGFHKAVVLSRLSGQFAGLRLRYHLGGVIIDDVSFASARFEIIGEMAASGPEDEAGRFECGLVVAWNRSGDPVAGTSERQLGKLEDCVVRSGKRAIGREAGNASVSHIADDELAQPGEL